MTLAGWLIGVLVQPPGEPAPLLHYFAVGHADQGKCEWTAVDRARDAGRIAESPLRGQEPVMAIRQLSLLAPDDLGLLDTELLKLITYADGRAVTPDDVTLLSASPEVTTPWALTERATLSLISPVRRMVRAS